ncbi:RNA polymerase factor sigma-54 [Yoonia sediminilitoris]|uniref:RNA polymerase sigma-54 factor n=1 Tax=Yoonia sediminilitoris TaxID=1286148 RepID=A0A2T6KC23_9RHOB|nr:hypothetical protein [Yoonia sediminilitoris]PUB12408.1 RNA polymerase RpoN-/SigL-like sigma 54 subunit [Yoonia sediminilitoris]RCW93102.1 RNA polymerase RpoN-/SigL-like sigma 54 subunit [Yoonia sediminilitoris]
MTLAPTPRPRQSQRLAMTPQLRQAIGLLKLDNRALSDALRKAEKTNPCISLRRPVAGVITDQVPAAPDDLTAHIAQQIRLAFDRDDEMSIAYALLEALEPWGWLGASVDTIAQGIGKAPQQVDAILKHMQSFEPTGVFARSLSECLALQADELGLLDPLMRDLLDHLDMIAAGEMDALARKCGCTRKDISTRLAALRGLDPKPGLQLAAAPPPPAAPDLLVTGTPDGWHVSLNAATLTEIEILPGLDAQSRRDAEQLNRAVARRNATALTVARQIVAYQAGYLDGAAHLVPVTLSQLAAATGKHESTVSRVTAALTVQTPRSVLSLRTLMGRGLRGIGAKGAAIPVARFESRLSALIKAENPNQPISDAQLARALAAEGIGAQRRTVAKYRAALGFPPAHKRRQASGSK